MPAVLHVIGRSHITDSFFQMLGDAFDGDLGVALLPPGDTGWEEVPRLRLVRPRRWLSWYLSFVRQASRADRVFVHSMSGRVALAACLAPWVLPRVFWLIWGADLYEYRRRRRSLKARFVELPRRVAIRRVGHLVSYVAGDVELARRWYGARGRAHECLLYPGNTVDGLTVAGRSSARLRVQLGNSADPSNEHEEVLRTLARDPGDVEVVVPLAYGDPSHRDSVVALGRQLLGDRFFAQRDLLPLDIYREQLRSVDVAVFAHHRQQGMGNTIVLLGLGKKVYLRSTNTQWELFRGLGITVFDLEEGFELSPIDPAVAERNSRIVGAWFSRRRLEEQWRGLLAESITRVG